MTAFEWRVTAPLSSSPEAQTGARRYLIVTADDFGLDESVNEAVTRAHRAGVLTAASLMVGAAGAEDAVERARALPELQVGLHLVLTNGPAVLPPRAIPGLVDARGEFGNNMLVDGWRYFALRSIRRQLEAEIRAQFVAFQRTGLVLDHLNAHKHFHLHPTVLALMLRIGREFGVPAIRLPREPLWFAARGSSPLGALAGRAFLDPWLALLRHRLRAAGMAHNDQLFGIAATGSMDEATLLEIIGRLPTGVTEIYLHPAMSGHRHAAELAALQSARVRAAIAASGATCGGFRDAARFSIAFRATP
jgi:hopanoid biosynthesis associated protein HpnK